MSPKFSWDWPHLQLIRRHLADVTLGKCKRLIFSMPPQHGKSESITIRYPLWRMEREPGLRVAVAAYNQEHVNRFSKKTRAIAKGRMPFGDSEKVNEWNLENGSSYLAVGVGGGITGMPVDLLMIDDPIKSREEADSETYRNKVWEWYIDDISTRLQENASVILTMTRWHEDDLVGKILKSDDAKNWRYVRLPAIAEDDDILGRAVGEPLCPQRFTLDTLHEKRLLMGEGFEGLYQQNPVPRGGMFLDRAWFTQVEHAVPDNGAVRRVRYWDTAATKKATSCYSAGVLMALVNNVYYVEDVIRGRWTPAERNAIIVQTARNDSMLSGFEKTWVEQEPGGTGIEAAERIITDLAGYPAEADKVTGDKVARATPFASQARVGNVRIIAGDWNNVYLSELATFPRGTYKDQVDATGGAFNKLSQVPLYFSVLDLPR